MKFKITNLYTTTYIKYIKITFIPAQCQIPLLENDTSLKLIYKIFKD